MIRTGLDPQTIQMVEVTGHASAWTALVGWLAGILPYYATTITAIWFTILVIEKATGKPFAEILQSVYKKFKRSK